MAEKNVTLDIKEFTDYVQPNNVVEKSGEVDVNYFQHQPYLDDFNEQNGTHEVSVAAIHVEPMGLYGGTFDKYALRYLFFVKEQIGLISFSFILYKIHLLQC